MNNAQVALLLGILIGEGSMLSSKQYGIVIKMHVRHEPILRRLHEWIPGSKLYGPYLSEGRNFYQLMIRRKKALLALCEILDATPWKEIDPHSWSRYKLMKDKLLPNRRRELDDNHSGLTELLET